MKEYPSVIVVGLYQTLHENYGSIKQTRKENYWTNLKRKEMIKLRFVKTSNFHYVN